MYKRFCKDKQKTGEVEELLKVREEVRYKTKGRGKNRKREKVTVAVFLVRWKNCDETDDSWEPRENLDEDSSEEYYLALSFSEVPADLTFLILHDVISSEGIIADEMYKRFLEDKKKARAAIFSKRAASATKRPDGGGPKMQVRGRFLGFTEIAEAVNYLIFCAPPFPSGMQ